MISNVFTTPIRRAPTAPIIQRSVSFCLVLFSWLIAHHYIGIRQDGVFYAAQAIRRIDPGMFRNDLFFAFGSQDNYSGFGPIYARAVEFMGLTAASAGLLAVGQLAWMAATAWLCRPLLSGLWYGLGITLLFSLPGNYGGWGMFQYAEPFLTARTWAEPAALLAAGFSVRGRWFPAIGCWLVSAVMHPIMALPAGLFIIFLSLRIRALLLGLLCGIGTIGALAYVGLAPFSLLLTPMDSDWLAVAIARSPFTFLDHWKRTDYAEPLFLALVLALRAFTDRGRHRRIWFAALNVFLIGLGLSVIPIVWPSVLVVQIQAWRVLWFVKVAAIIAAASLAADFWKHSSQSRLLIGGLAVCALNIDNPVSLGAALMLAVAFGVHHRYWPLPTVAPTLVRVVWLLFGVILGMKLFAVGQLALAEIDLFRPTALPATSLERTWLLAQQLAWFVAPSMFIGGGLLLRTSQSWIHWVAMVSSAFLAFVSLAQWDARSPLQTSEEDLWSRGIPQLSAHLEPDKLVYWDGGLRDVWFGLRRAHYASAEQLAGVVFSRETAIEGRRRLRRLAMLGVNDANFSRIPSDLRVASMPMERSGLIHVCHDPILDYVILPKKFPEGHVASFSLDEAQPPAWHVHDCAILRGLTDPHPPRPPLP